MDNLRFIEIRVLAPNDPEALCLIEVLREVYGSSDLMVLGAPLVSYSAGTAVITHARAIHTDSHPSELRDREYSKLAGLIATTCPRAHGFVEVCALVPSGPTYKAEFYSCGKAE